MAAEVLRTPAFLGPKQTLAITSRASSILKSLQPTLPIKLPYPFSLLTNADSPEKWASYENLLAACLISGDDESALRCLTELSLRFGETNEKVLALKGMYQEAIAGDDETVVADLLAEYEEILREHPEYMLVRKRRVALLRSSSKKSGGSNAEAVVKGLVKILDVSPTDAESWAELAEVYGEMALYERSVYCWEEALLVMPFAWNVHARIGEVELVWANSSDSDKEKMRLLSSSLRRYCRAIELCDNYLRGYYGLYLTSTKLLQLLEKNQKAAAADMSVGDLGPPPVPAVESLKELAAEKLGEIVRRGSAREHGWDGYDEAELHAARELLGRGAKALQR